MKEWINRFGKSFDWPFTVSGRGKITDPFGDWDHDGIPNMNDCRPRDPKKQDVNMYARPTPESLKPTINQTTGMTTTVGNSTYAIYRNPTTNQFVYGHMVRSSDNPNPTRAYQFGAMTGKQYSGPINTLPAEQIIKEKLLIPTKGSYGNVFVGQSTEGFKKIGSEKAVPLNPGFKPNPMSPTIPKVAIQNPEQRFGSGITAVNPYQRQMFSQTVRVK